MDRKIWLLSIPLIFIFTAAELQGQVGRTTSTQGSTSRQVGSQTPVPLTPNQNVLLDDRLLTALRSKLGVLLLLGGNHFVLGESVEVQVALRQTARREIELILEKGSLRVITGGQVPIVTRTSPAQAEGVTTGYLAHCGPPEFAEPDSCLFLGVYGRTEVTSFAAPNNPVVLDRQFFTIVRMGQAPTDPEPMGQLRFRYWLDRTTIVGTGSENDRVVLEGFAETPEIRPGFRVPKKPADPDFPFRVPVDPEPPEPLPDPPEPPRPPL